MIRQADGKLIAVVGTNFSASSDVDIDLVRFTDSGAPDPGFGSGGAVTLKLPANDYLGAAGTVHAPLPVGLVIDDDGRLVISLAAADDQGLAEQAIIVRLDGDGSLDTTWGPNGIQTYSLGVSTSALHAVCFQTDGKLLAAGRRWTRSGSSDFVVMRTSY